MGFRQLKHEIQYIYWKKESSYIYLSNAAYEEKLKWYQEHGTRLEEKTDRYKWITADNPYREDERGKYYQLYTYEGVKKGFVRYSTSGFDTDKVINPGRDAFLAVVNKLRDQTGDGRDVMYNCFGTVEEEFKRCIPKQFYHINERYTQRMVFSASGIDFCAHFPTNLRGRLPNAKTAITVAGTVKPSEAYPFAFYLKSGHYAEFGRMDSHEWLSSVFSFRLFEHKKSYDWDLSVELDDDVTVLMRASDVELTDIMEYYYSQRALDPMAKLVMNAFIGYLHKDQNYNANKYAHIAAVALMRSNQAMLDMAERIGFEKIIQVCVDGCIYAGPEVFGVKKKAMGNAFQEFTNAILRIDSTNKYIITDQNENIIKYKMQGCNYVGDKKVDRTYVPKFEDMSLWRRDVMLKTKEQE